MSPFSFEKEMKETVHLLKINSYDNSTCELSFIPTKSRKAMIIKFFGPPCDLRPCVDTDGRLRTKWDIFSTVRVFCNDFPTTCEAWPNSWFEHKRRWYVQYPKSKQYLSKTCGEQPTVNRFFNLICMVMIWEMWKQI